MAIPVSCIFMLVSPFSIPFAAGVRPAAHNPGYLQTIAFADYRRRGRKTPSVAEPTGRTRICQAVAGVGEGIRLRPCGTEYLIVFVWYWPTNND